GRRRGRGRGGSREGRESGGSRGGQPTSRRADRSSARLLTPSLWYPARRWLLTVRTDRTRRSAMSRLGIPWAAGSGSVPSRAGQEGDLPLPGRQRLDAVGQQEHGRLGALAPAGQGGGPGQQGGRRPGRTGGPGGLAGDGGRFGGEQYGTHPLEGVRRPGQPGD